MTANTETGNFAPRIWKILCLLSLAFSYRTYPIRAQANDMATEVLPRRSAELIIPILDLRNESLKECGAPGKSSPCADGPGLMHQEARARKIGRLVGRLIENNTAAADRAIIVLLHYDVGPSEAEDLLTSAIGRGKKRVLPYLLKYRDEPPQIPGRSYPESMLNDREFQRAMFDHAIKEIKDEKSRDQQ